MGDKNLCWETGKPLPEGMKDTAHFLTTDARTAWNNRRKNRGAVVYDLIMSWRYDRPRAKALKVFSLLCQLAKEWHDEDKSSGRISFNPTTIEERAGATEPTQ